MRKTKVAGMALTAAMLVGGPLGAAPAQAGCVHYVCKTAFDTLDFTIQEARDAHVFVGHTWDGVGTFVLDTLCDVSPSCP